MGRQARAVAATTGAKTGRRPHYHRAMRIRYIEIFHAVMQCGTVKGAAEMLHITQPAATRLLQQAERQAGFALFQRVKGRLVPTEEARALYPEVEQLYLRLDGIRRLVSNLAHGQGSLLRVMCVPSLSQDWLPQAIGRVARRHPQSRFAVRTLHSWQIFDGLVLREADIGFGFDVPTHPALAVEPVAEGRIVCVGPGVGTRALTLEDLARRPVIDLDPFDPLGRLLHHARVLQGVEFDARLTAHSYHTAVALARQGLGVALVDSFTACAAQQHVALPCVPLEPAIPVTVYAVRLQEAPTSALLRNLVECVRDALQHEEAPASPR